MKKTIIAGLFGGVIVVCLMLCFGAWDNTLPAANSQWNDAAGEIRDNWDAMEVQFGVDLAECHPYYQSGDPEYKPDGSTSLDSDDLGRLWVDSDDNLLYVLTSITGPTWTAQAAADAVTAADVTFTLTNTDEEDSDGGRQSRFISKGEQSGGEATTLGWITFSHDGSADDEKGKCAIALNDGNDTNTPSKTAITYGNDGKIIVDESTSVVDTDVMDDASASTVPTSESVKAYVDTTAGYVSRGTTASFDLTLNDAALDTAGRNQWNAIDLSGFVPTTAEAVVLRVNVTSENIAEYIDFGKNANEGTASVSRCIHNYSSTAVIYEFEMTVEYDGTNEQIMYFVPTDDFNGVSDEINIFVKGWHL